MEKPPASQVVTADDVVDVEEPQLGFEPPEPSPADVVADLELVYGEYGPEHQVAQWIGNWLVMTARVRLKASGRFQDSLQHVWRQAVLPRFPQFDNEETRVFIFGLLQVALGMQRVVDMLLPGFVQQDGLSTHSVLQNVGGDWWDSHAEESALDANPEFQELLVEAAEVLKAGDGDRAVELLGRFKREFGVDTGF